MAGNLRTTYRVAWDNGSPIEVTTGARDMVTSADYQTQPGYAIIALVHAALERCGHEPPKLEDFIDQLDDFELVQEAAVPAGPTKKVPTRGGRVTSPSSRGSAGGSSSKKTTTAPSARSRNS